MKTSVFMNFKGFGLLMAGLGSQSLGEKLEFRKQFEKVADPHRPTLTISSHHYY